MWQLMNSLRTQSTGVYEKNDHQLGSTLQISSGCIKSSVKARAKAHRHNPTSIILLKRHTHKQNTYACVRSRCDCTEHMHIASRTGRAHLLSVRTHAFSLC